MKKVVMIGSARAAEILYPVISRNAEIEIAAFSVHKKYIDCEEMFGKKVVAFEELSNLFPPSEFHIINAVGYGNINKNRESTFIAAKEKGYSFFTFIHQSVTNYAQQIGESAIIMPGAVLEPGSMINSNSVIWSNVVVAHHVEIEENCWIASGVVIAGGSKIKRNSFLGINSTIANKVTVEEYNIIGANTLISKNTSPYGVYLARSGEAHRFASIDYAKHFLV